MAEQINRRRRWLLGAAAAGAAAAQLGTVAVVRAQSATGNAASASTVGRAKHAGFAVLRQIDAGDLSVGYAEAGPATGTPVLLLHGWPTTSTPMST
jgi:fermentation-respiration switch protein FrsA (DUF1100 family)